MKKDLDAILEVLITLFDMSLSVFKGIKRLRKHFKKRKLSISKTI